MAAGAALREPAPRPLTPPPRSRRPAPWGAEGLVGAEGVCAPKSGRKRALPPLEE